MKNSELAGAWLKRAISNLEKAKIGKISDTLFYEDLCFDCQQAAEKA
ncbi:MAG: HEPN domain-containing protein [Firmicutes bacterium]|nr:HEPN domain-containing protein [Bacillota bacterium]